MAAMKAIIPPPLNGVQLALSRARSDALTARGAARTVRRAHNDTRRVVMRGAQRLMRIALHHAITAGAQLRAHGEPARARGEPARVRRAGAHAHAMPCAARAPARILSLNPPPSLSLSPSQWRGVTTWSYARRSVSSLPGAPGIQLR